MDTVMAVPTRVSAQQLLEEEYPLNETAEMSATSFAREARATLGYKVPQKVQFSEGRVPTLLTLFREHGFSLYRPDEVATYQKDQGQKAEKLANRWFYFIQRVVLPISLLATITFLILPFMTLNNIESASQTTAIAAFALMGVFLVVSIICALYLASGRRLATWNSYKYSFKSGKLSRKIEGWFGPVTIPYDGVLPKSSLEIMIQIKKAIPNVRFKLDVLEIEDPRVMDPILFAYLPGEKKFKAPVAIWEEPDFHGQLIDSSEL